METLIDDNNIEHKDKPGIKKCVLDFYKNLYTSQEIDRNNLDGLLEKINVELTEEEKESCEGIISERECKKMVGEMNKNKSPGSDGLTTEFYQAYWELIGRDLTETLNNIYLKGELTKTMKESIITLIYKEKGDKRQLKNWRPISLLNTDYKILTKVLAKRLGGVMSKLISKNQACGVPGRKIHDILYYIQELYEYYQEGKGKGIIYAIDQEKAYDRLKHAVIHGILDKMNFGFDFKRWVKILYTDMRAKINIKGEITEYFEIQRSVRQGCPISMLLFVLAAEILGQGIRLNGKIRGLRVPNTPETKVQQYADDTTFLIQGARDIKEINEMLKLYESGTGAKVNKEKTEILLLGTWTTKEKANFEFKNYVKSKIKLLGVYFGEEAEKANWENLPGKIERTLQIWENRALSLKGKVILIKALALSKLWYIGKVTGIPKSVIVTIEKILFKFLWGKRNYEPIKRKVMKNSIKEGGVDFPDIKTKIRALLVHRVTEIISDRTKTWEGLFIYRLGYTVRDIIPEYARNIYAHTLTLTKINKQIREALIEIKGKIKDWGKESVKSLTQKLRCEREVPNIETKLRTKNFEGIWEKIDQSSKIKKRVEWNYLAAHRALPTGDWLNERNIRVNVKCISCGGREESVAHA